MDSGIYGYCRISDNKVIFVDKAVDIMYAHAQHLFPHTFGKSDVEKALQDNPDDYYLKIFCKCSIDCLDQKLEEVRLKYFGESSAGDESCDEVVERRDDEKSSTEVIDEFGGIEFLRSQKARGLTQKQIAERFGYKHGSVISAYVKKHGYRWSDL